MSIKKVTAFDVVNKTILIIIAGGCIYPFLHLLFVSLSDGNFLMRGEVSFLPEGINIEAYKYILSNPRFNILSGIRNSFIYTSLGTVVSIITTFVTAFVLSRKRFVHRNWIMSLFVITWVFEAGIIPQYIVYSRFGFVDNPLVMIIPGAINVQFLIIAKAFLMNIPEELEEAAFIDGANDMTILVKIFIPLSTTIFATLGTFYAVTIWNQYLIPQIYLKSVNLHTIQQVIKSVVITDSTSGTIFRNIIQNGIVLSQENLKAAAIFTAMFPIVCIYPFVLKYLKRGILIGAVKG